jgi:hypothetical protein
MLRMYPKETGAHRMFMLNPRYAPKKKKNNVAQYVFSESGNMRDIFRKTEQISSVFFLENMI